jgi:CRISPR type I-E-associated protein CasB/Cse2
LRRARDRVEAMLVAEALALGKSLVPDSKGTDDRFATAIDLARVLSHVTEDETAHPMRRLGWKEMPVGQSESERPKLSETRFRRFLLATDGEERVDAFVRLIDLMGGSANVGEIADAFGWWNHPDGRVRQSWAFNYYNAAGFTPAAVIDIPSKETA